MASKRKSIFDSVRRLPEDQSSLDEDILQLESIDQDISKTLSLIHYNLDACNSIISNKFIPLLLKYKDSSKNINNSTRFLKNLFENSLNVNIQVQQQQQSQQNPLTISKEIVNNNYNKIVDEVREKGRVNQSESILSESILSNELSSTFQNPPKLVKSNDDLINEESHNTSDNIQTTPTGKRELNNLFANRSRTVTESSRIDFLNNNSIIDQNTSTLTVNKDENDDNRPRKRPMGQTSPFKIQVSPIKKRQRVNNPTTPKRKNRKSAVLEKLDIEESPEDIPKTPELTYLKFSPIKVRQTRIHNSQPPSRPHTSIASMSSTTLEIPQLATSLIDNETNTSTTGNYQAPSFFDSSSSNIILKSPPETMKFALPKSASQYEKSPVKALARRYTKDYLDMAVDDDESDDLGSFELKNKRYDSVNNTTESTIDKGEESFQ